MLRDPPRWTTAGFWIAHRQINSDFTLVFIFSLSANLFHNSSCMFGPIYIYSSLWWFFIRNSSSSLQWIKENYKGLGTNCKAAAIQLVPKHCFLPIWVPDTRIKKSESESSVWGPVECFVGNKEASHWWRGEMNRPMAAALQLVPSPFKYFLS